MSQCLYRTTLKHSGCRLLYITDSQPRLHSKFCSLYLIKNTGHIRTCCISATQHDTEWHLEYKIPVSKFIGIKYAVVTWRHFIAAERVVLMRGFCSIGPTYQSFILWHSAFLLMATSIYIRPLVWHTEGCRGGMEVNLNIPVTIQ